jgi:N-glycosylase/DNA lyase
VGKSREVTRPLAWSAWQPLTGVPSVTADVLAEILDGGQAFRWRRVSAVGGAVPSPREPDGAWLGVWSDCVARVRLTPGGEIAWSAPESISPRIATALPEYFATACDFAALADSLPWRSDAPLASCLAEFRGLRILRQPFGETLLGFLCSATKQIVQIKQMLALLASRHGAEIAPGFHALPTWPQLAAIPEAKLRACQLGFRAKFIHQTAQLLAAHDGWLEATEALPYADAKARLCSLPGVGEKIADCVLLFGAGKLEAFPVDTWILKTMARRYALDGWRPAQVAQFGRAHFGPLAGLAQQFLFAAERRAGTPNRLSRNT